jgi:hypothetical protein
LNYKITIKEAVQEFLKKEKIPVDISLVVDETEEEFGAGF